MTRQLKSLAVFASLLALTAVDGRAQEIYSTDFSTLDGWSVQTSCASGYAWAADAPPASRGWGAAPFMSGPASLNFNNGVDIGGLGVHGGAAYTCGGATSPPIDLSAGGSSATLSFWVSVEMESGCQWDELRLVVRPAGGGTAFHDECIMPQLVQCDWQEFTLPLDVQWGTVEISFWFDVLDDWFNQGSGPFIDDLVVTGSCAHDWSTHCIGVGSVSTGLPAVLEPVGSFSVSTNRFQLQGSDFPTNTFAVGFYGAQTATIPLGNGIRCIAAAQSFRLALVPTRALGRPHWNVDLGAPPLPTGQVIAGSTWYFQSIFRDGPGFNFSDAIQVTFCD